MIYKVTFFVFFILFTFIVSAKSMVYGISKTVHVIKVRFKTSQYARHLESGIIGLWSGGGWGEGGVRGREET